MGGCYTLFSIATWASDSLALEIKEDFWWASHLLHSLFWTTSVATKAMLTSREEEVTVNLGTSLEWL